MFDSRKIKYTVLVTVWRLVTLAGLYLMWFFRKQIFLSFITFTGTLFLGQDQQHIPDSFIMFTLFSPFIIILLYLFLMWYLSTLLLSRFTAKNPEQNSGMITSKVEEVK